MKRYSEPLRQHMLAIEEYLNRKPCGGGVTVLSVRSAPASVPGLLPSLEAWLRDARKGESLYQMVCRLLEEKGFPNDAAFYKYARIEKTTFSNLRRPSHRPSRETVFKLIIALQADYPTAQLLMQKASFAFGDEKRDQIIVYCVEEGVYDVETVYDILEAFEVPNIY